VEVEISDMKNFCSVIVWKFAFFWACSRLLANESSEYDTVKAEGTNEMAEPTENKPNVFHMLISEK